MLKQKLFDYVSQSECAEGQDRLSSLKWVLKNKGEKVGARLVVREIKKAKLEDENLEPSDLYSAKSIPPTAENWLRKLYTYSKKNYKSTEYKHETNHINNKYNDTNMNTRKMHNL